jgi:hypothetical protein
MSATMSPVKEEIFAKVDEEYLAKKLQYEGKLSNLRRIPTEVEQNVMRG